MAGEVTERLGAARCRVERVCAWLAHPSPAVLERCTDVLAAASSELGSSAEWFHLARGDPDALAETWKLRRAVRRAAILLEHASQYHIQWTRVLGGKVDGYRPGGAVPPLFHPPKIDLQG